MATARPTINEGFSLTPIGTCRLSAPIRLSASDYGLVANRKRVYGYSHSIPEAVQQVRFLQQEYRPDPAIWHVISGGNLSEKIAEIHGPSDIYLVELSSRKQISVDGHAIQLNYLKSSYSSFFEDRERNISFWRAAESGDSAALRALLRSVQGAVGLKADDVHLLTRIRLSFSNDDEFIEGLDEIRSRLGDPIVVTHVDAVNHLGKKLDQRSAYIAQVEMAAATLGLSVFNPSSLVQTFGQDAAIEKESNSLAHFTDTFSKAVFAQWNDRYLSPRFDGLVAQSPTTLNCSRYRRHVEASMPADRLIDTIKRLDGLLARLPEPVEDLTALSLDFKTRKQSQDEAYRTVAQAVRMGANSKAVLEHALRLAVRQHDLDLCAESLERLLKFEFVAHEPQFIAAIAAVSETDAKLASRGLEAIYSLDGTLTGEAFILYAQIALEHQNLVDRGIVRSLIHRCSVGTDVAYLAKLVLEYGGDEYAFLKKLKHQSIERFSQALVTLDSSGHRGIAIQTVSKLIEDGTPLNDVAAGMSPVLDLWEADLVDAPTGSSKIELARAIVKLDGRRKGALKYMRKARKEHAETARRAYRAADADALRAAIKDASILLPKLDEVPYFLSRVLYAQEDYKGSASAAQMATDWAPDVLRNWTMMQRASYREVDVQAADHAAHRVLDLAGAADEKPRSEAELRISKLPSKALSAARRQEDPIQTIELLKIAARDPMYADEVNRRDERAKNVVVRELRMKEKESAEDTITYARRALPHIDERIVGLISAARSFSRARLYEEALPLWERVVAVEPEIGKWKKQLEQCRVKTGTSLAENESAPP